MRRILLAAVLVAVAAPASAETAIWTGEVHVEKWVTDDGSEFYGYWRVVGFGNIPGFGRSRSMAAPTRSNCSTSRTRRGLCSRAPRDEVHRASCRATAVWRGWSMGSGSSSPTTTGASPIRAWRCGTTPGSTGRTVRWCRCSSYRRRHRFRRCRSPVPSCSPSYCSSGGGDDDCRLPIALNCFEIKIAPEPEKIP